MDFKKEYMDKELNIKNLNQEFNISDNTSVINAKSNELELTDSIDESKVPDNILYDNIDRANGLLDKIITQADAGNVSGLMMSSAAKLIDSVTTATNSIMGVSTQTEEMEYKDRVLALKEKEMMVKLILAKQKKGENVDNLTQNIQNNVIVASRESIIDMLEQYNDDSKKIIENR